MKIQQREHNSHDNKRRELYSVSFWESCPGSSPSQQTWELLVQGFRRSHCYNNTHLPDWLCHTTAHQNPLQAAPDRFGQHTGTLTLTPDLPRLTITLGGMLLEITLSTVTQWAITTPPAPFFPQPVRITRYSSASLFMDKLDPLNGSCCSGD